MTDPIQEQLTIARQNQILDAASSVFAEKGFHPTTIKDIAREAGIADGTIYNYFKNKQALLIGIFNRMRSLVQPEDDQMQDLIEVDFRTFLKSFLQLPLNTLHDNDFQLFRVVVSEMMVNDDLRQLYYEQIIEPTLAIAETYLEQWAKKQGQTLDIPMTVRTLSSVVMGVMMHHIMGDQVIQAHWDDLPDILADMIIRGLEQ